MTRCSGCGLSRPSPRALKSGWGKLNQRATRATGVRAHGSGREFIHTVRRTDVAAFCDFAAGGDENVLAVRRGNKVGIVAAWRERDTMKAVGRFIQLFREQKLSGQDIAADEGGLGIVMCDRLAESGWHVQRVNNGASADNADAYANKAAEIWFEGRTQIERQQIILPNDRELIAQLTSRLGWPDSKGRLQLESKDKMRSRGLSSPDRADAVLGAIMRSQSGGQVARAVIINHDSHDDLEFGRRSFGYRGVLV